MTSKYIGFALITIGFILLIIGCKGGPLLAGGIITAIIGVRFFNA